MIIQRPQKDTRKLKMANQQSNENEIEKVMEKPW